MNFRRLFDIFPYQQAKFPNKRALSGKQGLKWLSYSTSDCIQNINRISAGLLDLGLKRGDKVAIMTPMGSPEWNFLDFGMQQIGLIVVPIHATVSTTNLKFIIENAAVRYCIVANEEQAKRLRPIQESSLHLKGIFSIQKTPHIPGLDKLMKEPDDKHLIRIESTKAAIHEDDLMTILYTSGTTGMPKGVMLSHKNIVSNIKSIIPLIPINCDKRALSFLPLSHIFERMVTYTYMAVGASVYYAEGLDQLMPSMREVRPHYFTTVPRLLEKMYEGIQEKVAEGNALTQQLFRWGIALGERYNGSNRVSLTYWLKLKLADWLIFWRWRRLLGGRIEGIIVGAAALQPKLGRLFSAAGLEIREGYGLTETAPVIAFNRFEPGGVRFGTVGIPVPGVEVKIKKTDEEKEEGEILVKGPNVMIGYFQRDELTQLVIDEEGWFYTGDVGKFVHKRFLQITDRKKDIFKTSKGKYVAPQPIENKLRSLRYIEDCVIVGFNRPFVTALIYPAYAPLKKWCETHNVHWTSPQFMVLNPKVNQLMEEMIQKVNVQLSNNEQIKGFHLLYEPWSIETGELTPTLKPKRPFIEEKYQRAIDEMYT